MKFRILSICLLAILLFGTGTTDVYAQRKATKKTTASSTTKKKTTSKTSSTKTTGPALTKANLVNSMIIGWINLESNPNDGMTYFELSLKDNNLRLYMYEDADFDGTWSVSGNTLNVKTTGGDMTLVLKSKDGGKTFGGTFTNNYINMSRELVAYNVTAPQDETLDAGQLINDIKNNKYIYYLGMYKGEDNPEIGIPVNVSFDFDEEDEATGTFKVTGNSKFLTAMGIIKSNFKFNEEQFLYTNNKGEEKALTIAKLNPQKFFLIMGSSRVPIYNNINLILYFIKKP